MAAAWSAYAVSRCWWNGGTEMTCSKVDLCEHFCIGYFSGVE